MILIGESMLQRCVHQFVEHYNTERNHQGLDNTIIDPVDDLGKISGDIVCRERLGGLLKYYRRQAA
jgi:hypothetical protein